MIHTALATIPHNPSTKSTLNTADPNMVPMPMSPLVINTPKKLFYFKVSPVLDESQTGIIERYNICSRTILYHMLINLR